mmetsp:Transcript_5223/g.9203  ORF Transcript_5223/g.9203 Transcript_5223/m.9203 type:complete len:704 (-) Transcript_5223:33-2144(-)
MAQTLVSESIFGQIDAEVGPALESGDREAMYKVKEMSDQADYITETVAKLFFSLSKIELQDALSRGNDIVLLRMGFKLADDMVAWNKKTESFEEYPTEEYASGKVLEAKLLTWEDLERELEELTTGQSPDSLSRALYRALLCALEKADGPLGEVERTVDQSKLYENAAGIATLSIFGQVDAEAPPALASGVRERMYAVKAKSESANYITETISKVYFALASMELQDALDAGNDIVLLRSGFKLADHITDWDEERKNTKEYPLDLYTSGRELECRLMEWISLEGTLVSITDGVKPEDVDVELYHKLLQACETADEALADVKRTKSQEELYAFAQELIHDSEPGWLDSESTPALESLDRKRMQTVKDRAAKIQFTSPTIEQICNVLDRLVEIDTEAKEAMDCLDGIRMASVLEDAAEYNHTSDDLQEIERMFKMPEKEFVKLELKTAIRLKDKVREIHRQIRLKEIFFEEEGEKFVPYDSNGLMREPMMFARAKGAMVMCGRTGIMRGMFQWTDKPLPAPLTWMPGESRDGDKTKAIQKMKKKCIKQFKYLQIYMGDIPTKKSPERYLGKFLEFGCENPDLRNELYCQIVKQLTNNRNEDSLRKGYEMLGFALQTFPPLANFENYLVMWIRSHPPPGGQWRPYTSALHNLQFSENQDFSTVRSIDELRISFDDLVRQGSRFSIAIGAFTGPVNDARKTKSSEIKL